jgi:uncharacterized membrane-anchored protein
MSIMTFFVLVSVVVAFVVLFLSLYGVVSWLVGSPRQEGRPDRHGPVPG